MHAVYACLTAGLHLLLLLWVPPDMSPVLPAALSIHVYTLRCSATNRCYVAQSKDLAASYKQHLRRPPSWMLKDAQLYALFERYIQMTDLGCVSCQRAADKL